MDLLYNHLIPAHFHPKSRVWVYQSSRPFGIGEALEIEDLLNNFITGWNSHGALVKGYANLFFGQFIIIMADETQTGVSGCSTDSSVRVIKEIESRLKTDLFNRQQLAFVIKDKVELLPLSQLIYAMEHSFINAETLYFNNLVQTKEELENKWLVPIKNSWLSRKLLHPSSL